MECMHLAVEFYRMGISKYTIDGYRATTRLQDIVEIIQRSRSCAAI
jgi:hypothetical protein